MAKINGKDVLFGARINITGSGTGVDAITSLDTNMAKPSDTKVTADGIYWQNEAEIEVADGLNHVDVPYYGSVPLVPGTNIEFEPITTDNGAKVIKINAEGGSGTDASGKLDANGWSTSDPGSLIHLEGSRRFKLSEKGVYIANDATFAETNLKFPNKSGTFATEETVTEKVAEVVASAPEDFDTLKEMSDWIATHGGDASKMNTDIKANADAIKALQEAGYLTSYTESDPTVPAWAKAEKKPTYTAEEVGALPSTTVIPTVPTKVSAFENDKGYLTKHQDISGKQDVLSFDGTYNKDTNKVATVKTVTDKVAEIVSDAPADFDTLKEMSDWIATHGGDASKMNTDIKANADAIKELQDAGYAKTSDIPKNLSDLTDDASHRTVSDTEKTAWNNKSEIGRKGTGENAEAFNHPTNVASGASAHAEGGGTTASGYDSHAEGNYTTASGVCSHAEGQGTIADGSCQHVQGRYNIKDTENKYAHIVGNGTADDKRSNAHTLDRDGNAWYAGDVYVGGAGQDDENAEKLVKQSELPTVPTKVSAFENDKGYLTQHQDISGKQDVLSFDGTYNKDTNKAATVQTVTDKVAEVVASAPEDFDTLKEMSDWISSHSTSAAQMNSKITTNGNRITGLINRIDNFSYNELKDKPFDGADTFTELFATDYVSFTQQTTYSVYTILNPTFNIEIGKKYKILIHDPQREEVLAELVTEASEDQGGYTVLGTYGDTLYAEYDMAGMTILYKGTVSYMVVSVQEYKPINLSYVDIKFDGTYNASTNKVATVQTVTNKIAQVVAGAPASFDTLKEMSDWMSAHASSAATMNSLISTNKTNISTNASNISSHTTRISALESTIGDAKASLDEIIALQDEYIAGNGSSGGNSVDGKLYRHTLVINGTTAFLDGEVTILLMTELYNYSASEITDPMLIFRGVYLPISGGMVMVGNNSFPILAAYLHTEVEETNLLIMITSAIHEIVPISVSPADLPNFTLIDTVTEV